MVSKPFVMRASLEQVELTDEQIELVSGGTGPNPPKENNQLTIRPTWEDNKADSTRSYND
jgi:hypothetical protein